MKNEKPIFDELENLIAMSFLTLEAFEIKDGHIIYRLFVNENGDLITGETAEAYKIEELIITEMATPLNPEFDTYEKWESDECPEFVKVIKDMAVKYKNKFGEYIPTFV